MDKETILETIKTYVDQESKLFERISCFKEDERAIFEEMFNLLKYALANPDSSKMLHHKSWFSLLDIICETISKVELFLESDPKFHIELLDYLRSLNSGTIETENLIFVYPAIDNFERSIVTCNFLMIH
jgi:hypothetical protein